MERRDFFISYTKTNRSEAVWVADTLTRHGYSVYIQARDIGPGEVFVKKMEEFIDNSLGFIAVWSGDYSRSEFAMWEFRAAFTAERQKKIKQFVPVCVEDFPLPSLYGALVRADLYGVGAAERTMRLLKAVGYTGPIMLDPISSAAHPAPKHREPEPPPDTPTDPPPKTPSITHPETVSRETGKGRSPVWVKVLIMALILPYVILAFVFLLPPDGRENLLERFHSLFILPSSEESALLDSSDTALIVPSSDEVTYALTSSEEAGEIDTLRPSSDIIPEPPEPDAPPPDDSTEPDPIPEEIMEEIASELNQTGRNYQFGTNVEQNYVKARIYFELAAAAGSAAAINNLGVLYEGGFGVKQDYAKAREYYEQAAEKGSAMGFRNLGHMYEYGREDVVEQNYQTAESYYNQAIEKGENQLAPKDLERLQEKMAEEAQNAQ